MQSSFTFLIPPRPHGAVRVDLLREGALRDRVIDGGPGEFPGLLDIRKQWELIRWTSQVGETRLIEYVGFRGIED